MVKFNLKLFVLILLALFLLCDYSFADEGVKASEQEYENKQEEVLKEQEKTLKAIEFLSGFGWNKLDSKTVFDKKPDYYLIPFTVDFDFNLKKLTKKFGFNPSSLVEFQLEPQISYVASPASNVEIGSSFMLKLGFLPETSKFQPYIKGGLGLIYMTQRTQEQSTKFNFSETAGVGMHYYFKKDMSLVAEFRYRHVSNAGIDKPNNGINTYFVLTGVSLKY